LRGGGRQLPMCNKPHPAVWNGIPCGVIAPAEPYLRMSPEAGSSRPAFKHEVNFNAFR
jgi:hypothetical protein